MRAYEGGDHGMLMYISERLRGNKEIVLAAVRYLAATATSCSSLLRAAKVCYCHDVCAQVKPDPFGLQYASEELKGDMVVALAAFAHEDRSHFELMEFKETIPVSEQLWTRKDLALAAVRYFIVSPLPRALNLSLNPPTVSR